MEKLSGSTISQGHGESLSRELLQVPLIIRYPQRSPPAAGSANPDADFVG